MAHLTPAALVTQFVLDACRAFAKAHDGVFAAEPVVSVEVRDGIVRVDLAMNLRESVLREARRG